MMSPESPIEYDLRDKTCIPIRILYVRVFACLTLCSGRCFMADDSALVRQWRFLKVLGSRHYGVTVKELADEMGVNEKTIRRDLQTFQQVGFQIEETTGEHGRKQWRLKAGKDQPEMSFAVDEALALSWQTVS